MNSLDEDEIWLLGNALFGLFRELIYPVTKVAFVIL